MLKKYTISESVSVFQRTLQFFKILYVLVHVPSGRKFARYILKNNVEATLPSSDWEIQTIELNEAISKLVKANYPIDCVIDDKENVYYEITNLLP